ncbi:hypothetical protein [Pseudomonas inefficax]|uniref:hypothetical protein n=1 Tax=Pseudomonas inefficax TaxID=2078786 RepID=UPI00404699A2
MKEKSMCTEGSVYFPPALLNAVLVNFEGRVDGYLLDARARDAGYRAAIFFDASNRYGNGDVMNTGKILEVSELHGYHLLTTVEGQRYVIVSYLMLLVDESGEGEQYQVMSLINRGEGSTGEGGDVH